MAEAEAKVQETEAGGKLSVADLVDNLACLFLSGFLAGNTGSELQFTPKTAQTERLSVWRAPQA